MISEKRESEIEIKNEGKDPGDAWFQRQESLRLRYSMKARTQEIDGFREKKRESGFREKRVLFQRKESLRLRFGMKARTQEM
jgi:hypothetical protein